MERNEAISFIKEYSNMSLRSEFDFGRTSLIMHRIDTGDARPFRQGLHRHPQKYMEVIDEEVHKMEASEVIEPSCSPWESNYA